MNDLDKYLKMLADCAVKIKKINDTLVWAIANEQVDQIRKLIKTKEVDVNQESHGWTPLIRAIAGGNLSIVQYLVEAGAELDKATSRGYTPLMMAVDICDKNFVSAYLILKYLLEEGVDVNKKDKNGIAALDIACNIDNINIVKRLVENGAKIDKELILRTYKEGKTRIAQYLEEKSKVIDLISAISEADEEKVRELVGEKRADVNQEIYGWTPLIIAIGIENLDIVKYLIEAGAKLDKATSKGYTPLMMAIITCNKNSESSYFVLRYLLEYGVDVNKKDKEGITALDIACYVNDIEVVEQLIKKGARISDELISWTYEKGNKEIANYLKKKSEEQNKKSQKLLRTTKRKFTKQNDEQQSKKLKSYNIYRENSNNDLEKRTLE